MDYLKEFWQWLVDLILSLAEPVFGKLADVIPDIATEVGTMAEYYGIVDYYLPLTFGIGCIASYFAFLLVFLIAKFILKLIPFGVG